MFFIHASEQATDFHQVTCISAGTTPRNVICASPVENRRNPWWLLAVVEQPIHGNFKRPLPLRGGSLHQGSPLPVGMIPAFSTIRITVRRRARVRCITPFGTTNPCRGESSTVRSLRSISN